MDYFTADEHYFHSNILMWRDDKSRRVFKSVDDMNRTMINNHNSVITSEDTTYHLGDFTWTKSWKDSAHILAKLNGKHILILGNHDLFNAFDYLHLGFHSVHTSLEYDYMCERFILIHDPAIAGVIKNQKFIHGHTHGLGKRLADNTYCVSVELHDYKPISIYEISEAFNK